MTSPAKRMRDWRLDFFRGMALIFIFLDHVPQNVLAYFTLKSVAFCDAAEVFIFISGYAAAMVYSQAFTRSGALYGSARIYKRVWQLYVAHLCLFMIYSAEVSYTVLRFNNPLFADELHVGDFLEEPDIAIIKALILQFQPTFLDILPLYISLLAVFPFFLMLLRRNIWLLLAPSFGLYLAANLGGLNIPAYPEGRSWFFDPFAWQFLFAIGATFGAARAEGRPLLPGWRWLTWVAVAIAVVGGAIQITWVLHGIYDPIPAVLQRALTPIDKTTLQPIRLVNFLALAIIVGQLVKPHARFLTSRFAWPVVICGQSSLEVFCLSILLAVSGDFIGTELGHGVGVQLVTNLVGVLAMMGLGTLIAWFRNGGRLPERPRYGDDPAVGESKTAVLGAPR